MTNDYYTHKGKNPEEMPYKELFNAMVHEAHVSMYILNGWQYGYVNQYFCQLTGYSEEELLTGEVTFKNMIHPEDLATVQQRIEKEYNILDSRARYRVRVYRKNGEMRYVEIHSTKKLWQGKNVLFGTVIDITAEIEASQQLKENEERLHSLFDYNPDAVFTFDLEGHFQSANPGCEELTGYSIDELLQLSFTPLIVSEDLNTALLNFDDAIRGMAKTYELAITRKDGKQRNLLVNNFPMKSGGNIVGTWGIAKDITDKIKHKKMMEELVFFDPLTRLPNRKLFEDRLKQVIERTGQIINQPAVLYMDLNRFKFINDSLGHHFGDELLKKIAERLVDMVDGTGTVGRFAGDEFAVLLPDMDQEQVFQLAGQLIDSLTTPFEVLDHSLTTSVSMGIAFSSGAQETVDSLIKKADAAMYCTKKYKIHAYTVYSQELDQQAAYKMNIERELKSAISNQQLALHYQPITDLKSGRLSAMEALIRWNHPELGMVPPDQFIPISEASGQIVPIGRWVLETACRQNKAWQDAGYLPIKICVNISTIQLQQPNFIQTVETVLGETGLEAKWLELEVTESILLEDTDALKDSLHHLNKLGVSLSIDDFGTGYTSLSYLRQFAFDRVKIDRSFVEDISNEQNGKAITATIISLAHQLNMTVVAEGIEDEIQLAFLQSENCDEGQGYYFSRPLPADKHDLDLLFTKNTNSG
ncbi:EAL domain-containing protein [Planococcus sp. CPCC 101016]|uniref:sensor domain-containing protein n=1 Tax=Planococcus sp. CPCC 101016 TaxID=2599617 RepID=UPI0011B740A4|nr:bifunctional diguanylate cyclase/phosphodiesterase [Planococcus sp. CPCC 101016]TWT07948.1 EAL domain-containing protein [Planococcus sp. CPCC 101016]